MSGRPPTRRPPTWRAHRAEQGRWIPQTVLHGRRMNRPTVVPKPRLPKLPNRRLPKHRRQNRRNGRHRFTASSSCLPPVGPVARRDGGGGDRALHASNFSDAVRAGAAPTEVALGGRRSDSSATILIAAPVDWSERKLHLGGAIGAAVLARALVDDGQSVMARSTASHCRRIDICSVGHRTAAHARLGRRTTRSLPLLPPPQKN
jgi:hypothetical protein